MLISGGPISSFPISSRPRLPAAASVTVPCPYIPARTDQASQTAGRDSEADAFLPRLSETSSLVARLDPENQLVARPVESSATVAKDDESTQILPRQSDASMLQAKIDEGQEALPREELTSSVVNRGGDNSFEILPRSGDNDSYSAGRTDECR